MTYSIDTHQNFSPNERFSKALIITPEVESPEFKLSSGVKTSRNFSGAVYPDGSFSVGVVPPEKKAIADSRHDHLYESQFDSFVVAESTYRGTEFKTVDIFKGIEGDYRLDKPPKSSQNHKTYGSKGLTTNGRRHIRGITAILQRQFTKRRLGFCTLTIPALTEAGSKLCLRNFGEIKRQFFQILSRHYDRRGIKLLYVSCTEVQPKRFKRTGVPYLHIHFVYVAKETVKGDWIVSASLLRSYWRRTLLNVLSSESFIKETTQKAFKASVDCRLIKKDIVAYIGKYLSKGGGMVQSMIDAGFTDYPSQWWSASKAAKAMYEAEVIPLDSPTCESLFYQLEAYLEEGSVTYADWVYVDISGVDYKVGVYGNFSNEAYERLRSP